MAVISPFLQSLERSSSFQIVLTISFSFLLASPAPYIHASFLSCLCLLLSSCLFFLFNPLFPFLLILLHIPCLSYNRSLKCYFHSSIFIWALVLLFFFLFLLTYAHISAFVFLCSSFLCIIFYTLLFLLFILLYSSYVILVLLF